MSTTSVKRIPAPSSRTKVHRHAGRARYDRETIHAILDEGLYGHVGVQSGGQPFVIPALYGRLGDEVFLHGSPLAGILGAAVAGASLCLTVTLLDGLVLARSAFHHSMNYRSVVVLGHARRIDDREEKLEALRVIVDHVVPGRSDDVRGANDKELAATEVVALDLTEASAKVRTGPPVDSAEDRAIPAWAGEVPLSLVTGFPVPDDGCVVPPPTYVTSYHRPREKSQISPNGITQ
jgi:nitroimidazol reductase NimA-like FMN-containing flavoprotein (pyridoxamine 5'-phosphate oxidase superfamily)